MAKYLVSHFVHHIYPHSLFAATRLSIYLHAAYSMNAFALSFLSFSVSTCFVIVGIRCSGKQHGIVQIIARACATKHFVIQPRRRAQHTSPIANLPLSLFPSCITSQRTCPSQRPCSHRRQSSRFILSSPLPTPTSRWRTWLALVCPTPAPPLFPFAEKAGHQRRALI